MRRLAMVASVVAVASLVVAVGLPRYGCAEGFLLVDGREFPWTSDDVVCVPRSGAYATGGEVSDRGAIKIATAIAAVIFGVVTVFALRARPARARPRHDAPEPGG